MHGDENIRNKLGSKFDVIGRYIAAKLFLMVGQVICAGGETVLEMEAAGVRFIGTGILNRTQYLTGDVLLKNGCVVQNLDGILDGKDVSRQMEAFADKIAPVLRNDLAITLHRQNPRGFKNLVAAVSEIAFGLG